MFKKIFCGIMLAGFILSCDGVNNVDQVNGEKDQISEEISKPDLIEYEDLFGKVFDSGSPLDASGNCSFKYECDCCAGNFLFNSDTTFYEFNYCIGDTTVYYGSYEIKGDQLIFFYSGTSFDRSYNWEYEDDSTQVAYINKIEQFERGNVEYQVEFCAQKIKVSYAFYFTFPIIRSFSFHFIIK